MTTDKTGILGAAGDLVIRQRLLDAAGSPISHGYGRTLAYLNASDSVWGSCEVQFTGRGYQSDSPIAYRVSPSVSADLGSVGFDIMTVATNHTCDFGEVGFLDTLSNLRSAGITPVGGGVDIDEALRPVIKKIGDLQVGILAVSCLLPPDTAATAHRPGVAPVRISQSVDFDPLLMIIEPGAPLQVRSEAEPADVARLCLAVTELRKVVDFVLVSVHWGYGRGDVLAEYQRPLAQAIVEAGADLILGNHTHSPGPIEILEGVPVIYSLGNHIAQQDWTTATPAQQAIFASIDEWSLVAKFTLGRHSVQEIELAPTYCDRSDGLPILIDEPEEAAAVFNRIQRLSAPYGTSFKDIGARLTVQI